MASEIWQEPAIVAWCQFLLNSFSHWTGRELIERIGSAEKQARALFTTPFVVVSHNTEADPILNYGNQVALDLWEMSWVELTRTPSRLTAEPVNQAERERMLVQTATRGFIDDYRGVRISKTGRRFLVEHAIVWNVVNARGEPVGQAATFSHWTVA